MPEEYNSQREKGYQPPKSDIGRALLKMPKPLSIPLSEEEKEFLCTENPCLNNPTNLGIVVGGPWPDEWKDRLIPIN